MKKSLLKKVLACVLAAGMAVSVAACGGGGGGADLNNGEMQER